MSLAEEIPTQWDDVQRATSGDTDAMGRVYTRYKPLLRACLLSRFDFPPETADEWLHDFFVEKCIQGRLLTTANPGKGRLRHLLRKSVRNYALDRIRKQREMLSLDERVIMEQKAEPTGTEEADELTKAVLAETLRRLQAHYQTEGRSAYWEVFWSRYVAPILDGAEPVPFDVLIQKGGFVSPQQAYNALSDAKRAFRRIREQVIKEFED